MIRNQFIDNLRTASRMLLPAAASTGRGLAADRHVASVVDSADLWLTPKTVEGFDPADFRPLAEADQQELGREVAAFRSIAQSVPADEPATAALAEQAREHLERVIEIVRDRLLSDWLGAQRKMIGIAAAAAESKGWHVEKDEKAIVESLLGAYKAPRLRIRTQDKEVLLDPIACFGSGRQGIVDLVIMPTYETVYLVTYRDDVWEIVAPNGTLPRRPLSEEALINTISRLAQA